MFRADLHCHSTCSDGSDDPVVLVKLAKSIGLGGLSITDHDSIEAYHTALPYAAEIGLPMISGIEFSADWFGESVHILGYCFNVHHQEIAAFCVEHQQRRHIRNEGILEKLKGAKMPLTLEEVVATTTQELTTIGRPHIAQAMVAKGYVPTIQEAFRRYIGEGKPCYMSGPVVSVEHTIDLLHRADALAILAHPQLIKNKKVLEHMFTLPFDGLEAYYARFPQSESELWVSMAKKHDWIITGGSDYHGTIKPSIELGCSFVDETIFRDLQKLYLKNSAVA